ncbi:MAG: hypothetical protein V7707_13595 [Motiliproteus sp.]
MSKTYSYTYGLNTDTLDAEQRQIQVLLQQATKLRHECMVDAAAALTRRMGTMVRNLLTLELPVFLSPTLKAPSMVACTGR